VAEGRGLELMPVQGSQPPVSTAVDRRYSQPGARVYLPILRHSMIAAVRPVVINYTALGDRST